MAEGPPLDDVAFDAAKADFVAFYRAQIDQAIRLAWLLTSGGADAGDIAQEAFLRMRKHFDHVRHPNAYLRTTLVRLCAERHRSAEREQLRLGLMAVTESDLPATHRETLEHLTALPYRQRAVLVLRYWADAPDDVIADALGVRTVTVRSLASRALARLRKELTDDRCPESR